MRFKSFFEAHQKYIDQIQDAIHKVSERPFNELFQGKERFLLKVYNPNFEKPAKEFGIFNKIDWDKRTIDGVNINTYIKSIQNNFEKEKQSIDDKEDKLIPILLTDSDIVQREFIPYANSLHDRGLSIKKSDNLKFDYQIIGTKSNKNYGYLFSDDIEKLNSPPIDKPLGTSKIYDLLVGLFKHKMFFNKKRQLDSTLSTVLWSIYDQHINHWTGNAKSLLKKQIEKYKKLKQAIDQNNIFYYLVFSRAPVDVLRMSNHKGISSCHRLGDGKYSKDQGEYAHCAIADAKNDGGVVYLIRGADVKKIKDYLNATDLFYDADRNVGLIQPIGRIRLRRFIDLKTGADFAVPTTLQYEQKYGLFTHEIYQTMMDYVRKHQTIFKNPPTEEYAEENIVMVGGTYSDENLEDLLTNFFGRELNEYINIKHKSGHMVGWNEELPNILTRAESLKPQIDLHASIIKIRRGNAVFVQGQITAHVPLGNRKLDKLDVVLSNGIDHNRVIRKGYTVAGGPAPNEYIGDLLTKIATVTEWRGNELTSSFDFYLNDPEELNQLVQFLQKVKNNWPKFEQFVTKQITDYLDSYEEE